jgi:uncharacterized protein (UPF0548 family)
VKASLAERVLTCEVGGLTAEGQFRVPVGYRGSERSVRLQSELWEFGAGEVLRWGVKTRSGFTVEGEGPVRTGQRYWLIAHVGPLKIREPVQVVAVVDEPDRKGFAYGTLTGHPVSGEEAFLIERRQDGSVWFSVRSVTRPSSGAWRLIHPLLRVAQLVYRKRYLRSLRS